ncbi:hypothetical protein VTN02DRAFT_2869 [Thermoascus thermophilus]
MPSVTNVVYKAFETLRSIPPRLPSCGASCSVQAGFFHQRSASQVEVAFLPYWATSHVQYAQNLLECSDEPIEYDHDDEDYKDNCFFFPEDCVCPPRKDSGYYESLDSEEYTEHVGGAKNDAMTPELPDIRMLDTEALGDLLEDNLSPPEITSILVFATNGAIFAYASPLSTRQLRNLSATYGAAYTSYAKTVSSGNLTGVNPASHPSSFVTAQSYSLGDVGSIVFEHENQVAVVTKIADKVLLAVVGPSRLQDENRGEETREAEAGTSAGVEGAGALKSAEPAPAGPNVVTNGTASATSTRSSHWDPSPRPQQQSPTPGAVASTGNRADPNADPDAILQRQYEIDRSNDIARLASLNLSSSPAILLALESKSAALGRFLSQKLQDLESPEDF